MFIIEFKEIVLGNQNTQNGLTVVAWATSQKAPVRKITKSPVDIAFPAHQLAMEVTRKAFIPSHVSRQYADTATARGNFQRSARWPCASRL